MARPRTPSNVLDARDSFRKNPQRRRKDIACAGDVGDPPARLDALQAEAWRELVDRAPKGVFTGSDRFSLEVMARMVAFMWETGSTAQAKELRQWLCQYGFTAAARAKISTTPEKPQSRYAEFS